MAELLSDDDISKALEGVDDWHREDGAIVRDLKFEDFAGAMAFVNDVATAAEEMNHHPDLLVHGWNMVRLVVTNHSAGGLTQPDFDLAATIDALLSTDSP
jgi:4a-hydroxytetrahydrobiopterin dehydratase